MRPRTIDEYAGQQHILGEGKLLRRMLKADAITSLILHGPPGTGKTTLAELIAKHTKRHFVRENAAAVGVARIREVIQEAERMLTSGRGRTILFLDEIHRFSRSQQDVLLGDVERGVLTLIGATTENPLFSVNSALVSRSTLFRLEPLTIDDIKGVLHRTIADVERGYGSRALNVTPEAFDVWAIKCDGDARRALTALEVAVQSADSTGAITGLTITQADAEASIQQKAVLYSAGGDQHFDLASAMIKSVRGGDPHAAVYWIARMLEGGEDPRFIARRLAILASEDIGNADPRALPLAAACYEVVERIGMPEARITLAQTACFLALCPKSNASYLAIDAALKDVREGRTVEVPVYLRDTNSSPMGEGERAKGYIYSHGEKDAVGTQDYLGVDKVYYQPTDRGEEKAMAERLQEFEKRRRDGGTK
jgi:putative ATPase